MIRVVLILPLVAIILDACHQRSRSETGKAPAVKGKPHSASGDTMIIRDKAAVFFYPDSLQLDTVLKRTTRGVFDASMHEYESQLKFTHRLLKEEWADIKVYEAKKVRWLQYKRADGTCDYVDLDKTSDLYGLYLFSPSKAPSPADMMNADTYIYNYFRR